MVSTDWDFSNATWELNTDQYVSPPSCLVKTGDVGAGPVALCKKAGTTALNEGRIVTWARPTWGLASACQLRLEFRNQRAVGGCDRLNCYEVGMNMDGAWGWWRLYDPTFETIASGSGYLGGFTFTVNTWIKLRITWWEDGGVLFLRVERYTGTEWVKLLDDMNDPDNDYSGAEVNRAGIFMIYSFAQPTSYVFFDDTEIWGPA